MYVDYCTWHGVHFHCTSIFARRGNAKCILYVINELVYTTQSLPFGLPPPSSSMSSAEEVRKVAIGALRRVVRAILESTVSYALPADSTASLKTLLLLGTSNQAGATSC
jgi:hypothetical protein